MRFFLITALITMQLSFFPRAIMAEGVCLECGKCKDCPQEGTAQNKTMVILKSFTASPSSSQVLLYWVTASETGTEGFYLYRSTNGVDSYEKVNNVIISARGTGYTGANYSYTDTSVADGKYYYKLVEVESTGHTLNYGPVLAMVGNSVNPAFQTARLDNAALDDETTLLVEENIGFQNTTISQVGMPETSKDALLKLDDKEEENFAKILGVMLPANIKNPEFESQNLNREKKEDTGHQEEWTKGTEMASEELKTVTDNQLAVNYHGLAEKRNFEKLKSVTITSRGILKWITIENGKPVLHISNLEKDLKRFGGRLAEYLFIDPTELKKEVSVTKKEIISFYKKHKIDYGLHTRIKLRHIFVKINGKATHKSRAVALAKINKIMSKIKKGDEFAKVAKANSESPNAKKGGDIGWITRRMILPDLENTAFSLKKGKVSRVIRSHAGYHILKVEDVWQGRYIPLKKVKADVKEKLITKKAWDLALKKSRKIQENFIENYKRSKLMQGKDGYYVVRSKKAKGIKLAKIVL